MFEEQPDQQDQPVELEFPLGYALSWGYPPSSPPGLYFFIFLKFFIVSIFLKFFIFLRYGNIFFHIFFALW